MTHQDRRCLQLNVQAQPAALGTEPLRIVDHAERLLTQGSRALEIHPRSFDRVLAVFDRDEHRTCNAALDRAAALNQSMVNDENVKVPFEAVVCVPCFDLWLLLHFEDVLAPLQRDQAVDRLRTHLADYVKGQGSRWAATWGRVANAMQRAAALTGAGHTAADGSQPHTNLHELVYRLLHLNDQAA
jgi:hypothetical protein